MAMGDEPTTPESPAGAVQQNGRPATLPGRILGGGARRARRVVGATGLDRVVESAVERSVIDALDSEMVDRIWVRLLDSEETQKLIVRIAEAPELREAVAAQSRGVLEDLAQQARDVAQKLDGAVERPARAVLRRGRRSERPAQAGFVTRLMALALDAGILNALFLVVSGLFALAASVVFPSDAAVVAVGATAWAVGAALYFLAFWATAGQTPGMRLMGIHLLARGSPEVGAWRAVKRLIGFDLCVLTLGVGFLPILFTKRRRGLQDWMAGAEVVYARPATPAAPLSEVAEAAPTA